MLAIQLIMPSVGDMKLVSQDSGTVTLKPIFFGGECAGPHVRLVDVDVKDGKTSVKSEIASYRIKIRSDGKIEIKKGQTAEETEKGN